MQSLPTLHSSECVALRYFAWPAAAFASAAAALDIGEHCVLEWAVVCVKYSPLLDRVKEGAVFGLFAFTA